MSQTARPSLFALLALATLSLPAEAHRAYNVTGFAGLSDLNGDNAVDAADAYIYSTNGSDGLWTGYPGTPAGANISYLGGSGPRSNTTGTSYYDGRLPVSWAALVHAAANDPGDSYLMSTADALTVPGAPSLFSLAVSGNATGTGLDFGLLRIDAENWVKLTVTADTGSSLQPFFALYSGWDNSWTGPGGQTNLAGGAAEPASTSNRSAALVTGVNNPLGSSELGALFLESNSVGAASVSYVFRAPTSGHYTVLIGGANGTAGSYSAVVETVAAPVPVPAAFWLLGSAVAGVVSQRRRTHADQA
jgi:hypothetical protein